MSDHIFVRHQGQTSGPFPLTQLKSLIESPSWSREHRWSSDGFNWYHDLPTEAVKALVKPSPEIVNVVAAALPPSSAPLTPMSSSALACPHCGSGNIQRCEMVYHSGVTNTTGRSTGIGVGIGSGGSVGVGVGGSASTSVSVTNLASIAAPPLKRPLKWGIIAACIALGIFSNVSVAQNGYQGNMMVIAAALVASGVSAFILIRNIRYNTMVFPGLFLDWSLQWMCLQCGRMFKR